MKWNKERIDEEHKLKDNYGLKNLRELWRAKSELRRIRGNVRKVLSTASSAEVGKQIIARLARYNIVRQDATLDDLLIINVNSLLERRLQTIVLKKGLARTMKQSRQLVTHGYISINGKRVTAPGYLVNGLEENMIGYYRPIRIDKPPSPEGAPEQKAHEGKPNPEAKVEKVEAIQK